MGFRKIIRTFKGLSKTRQKPGNSQAEVAAEARIIFQSAATLFPQVCAKLENRFLASSTSLEKLHQQGSDIVDKSTRLVQIATGRDVGRADLEQAMKCLEKPLELLNECQGEFKQVYRQLVAYESRIQHLQSKETELKQAMSPLKFIQTLLKIESAPLSVEAQAMFTALSIEIERLQLQMGELFENKFKELHRVQVILQEVCAQLGKHTTTLDQYMDEEQKTIRESLHQLERGLDENQHRESKIGALSRELAGHIEQMVLNIQFQDIVSQKLQHIGKSLEDTRTTFQTRAESLEVLAQPIYLEAQHLRAAREDIQKAENGVRTGLQAMLNSLTNADADCLSLREFNHITTAADGMVQILLNNFKAVRREIGEVVTSSNLVYEALNPVTGLASGVTNVVKELSQNIHLIGLNAQVQAAQFQEGAGLAVISYRMSEISRMTTELSQSIALELDGVSEGLASGLQIFARLRNLAQIQQANLVQDGQTSEANLHGLRNGGLEMLGEVGVLIDAIKAEAEACMNTIDYVAVSDPALAQLQERLEKISEQLAAMGISGDATSAAAPQRSFSMSEERAIHENALARFQQNQSPLASASPLEAGAAQERETALASIATIPTPDSANGFTSPSANPVEGSEFGENVEMF